MKGQEEIALCSQTTMSNIC